MFHSYYNPRQNTWNNVKKSSKISRDCKTLVSIFVYFLTAINKVYFLEQKLGTRLYLHPSLKSFGNSYARFAILAIKFRFTYGELDLC